MTQWDCLKHKFIFYEYSMQPKHHHCKKLCSTVHGFSRTLYLSEHCQSIIPFYAHNIIPCWTLPTVSSMVCCEAYFIDFCMEIWLKACVRYFSLFLKDKCISSLIRTKYIEKKFNLQLFFLLAVSRTFILSWATTRYLPRWNFLLRKNNCMCNRDNACDVAACPEE